MILKYYCISIIFIIFTLKFCYCVDRSKFKKCEDIGFCKRHRTVTNSMCSYSTNHTTLKYRDNYFTLLLTSDNFNCGIVRVKLYFLKSGAIRVKFTEYQAKPRWEDNDIIQPDGLLFYPPISLPIEYIKEYNLEVEDNIHYITGDNITIIKIQTIPFVMSLYYKNELKLILNKDNKLYWEHYEPYERTTVTTTTTTTTTTKSKNHNKKIVKYNEAGKAIYEDGSIEEEEIKENNNNNNNNNGLYEESFGGHTDSKPKGPESIGIDISYHSIIHLYGIPEHATKFILKNTKPKSNGYNEPYRLYNLDVLNYEVDEPMSLYGSIPFLVGAGVNGSCGVFYNNPSETLIDIDDNNSYWMSEAGILDLFLFVGKEYKKILYQYHSIVGFTPIPPLFSLGYHQSHWNYKSQKDVLEVHQKFEDFDIPYDVLWLDIEHTINKQYFTYDEEIFPNPRQLIDELWSKGRRMVNVVDPHLSTNSNYKVNRLAKERDLFIKDSKGNIFTGQCWPGESNYMDFRNPKVREFWSEMFDLSNYDITNHTFIWNDMNEPSVFDGPEVTMPKDCIGYDKVEHRYWHNINGYYVTKATYEALLNRDKNHNIRPFVLGRSFYSGSNKYCAVWSGDIPCEFKHLENTVSMLLSMSISGHSFYGSDIPGFMGDASEELYIRGYELGVWLPFFRSHAHIDSKRREPWSYSNDVLITVKRLIVMRYSFLPYWYTLFANSYRSGEPIIRPIWMEFPHDKKNYEIEDEYLVGKYLLVHPTVIQDSEQSIVRFPNNENWYDIYTYKRYNKTQLVHTPLGKTTVFQRGGSIIFRKMRVRRSSELMKNDPYTMIIIVNEYEQADGELYIDDGVSFNYKNKNEYIFRSFSFRKGVILNRAKEKSSSFESDVLIERIIIAGYKHVNEVILYQDNKMTKLLNGYNDDIGIMVIRNPKCYINMKWKIVMK